MCTNYFGTPRRTRTPTPRRAMRRGRSCRYRSSRIW
jgi:hypothetical protein